jgi:hypothetical protein
MPPANFIEIESDPKNDPSGCLAAVGGSSPGRQRHRLSSANSAGRQRARRCAVQAARGYETERYPQISI